MELNEIKKEIENQKESEKNGDKIALLSEIAKLEEEKTPRVRYSTGLDIFDWVFKRSKQKDGGLAGGEVLAIAAPTGNGKTLLASTISFNMLRKHGLFFLYFTFEVNVADLYESFKEMGASDEDVIVAPMKHTSGNLEWIEKKIIEAKQKFLIKTVVIDHLGFLSPKQSMNQSFSSNYSSYLAQTVREVKTIAVKHDIIILLPVHMNKSATDEPTMRDIGNSSGIGQETDGVILMARKESYEKEYYSDISTVILGKNRPGGKHPKWYMHKKDGRLQITNQEPKKDAIF